MRSVQFCRYQMVGFSLSNWSASSKFSALVCFCICWRICAMSSSRFIKYGFCICLLDCLLRFTDWEEFANRVFRSRWEASQIFARWTSSVNPCRFGSCNSVTTSTSRGIVVWLRFKGSVVSNLIFCDGFTWKPRNAIQYNLTVACIDELPMRTVMKCRRKI